MSLVDQKVGTFRSILKTSNASNIFFGVIHDKKIMWTCQKGIDKKKWWQKKNN